MYVPHSIVFGKSLYDFCALREGNGRRTQESAMTLNQGAACMQWRDDEKLTYRTYEIKTGRNDVKQVLSLIVSATTTTSCFTDGSSQTLITLSEPHWCVGNDF